MDIKKMLKCALFTPGLKGKWGLPVKLEGAPGSAKTGMVEALGRDNGLHVETVIASVRQPEDFGGMPFPSEDGNSVKRLADRWVTKLIEQGAGIAFFDEGNTAPESTQAAMLRGILDRVFGDAELPARVRIMWAQNRVGEAAGGHDLAAPLANRMVHLAWEGPSYDDWCSWVLTGDDESEDAVASSVALEDRVMKGWPVPFAKARGLITGFIRHMPGELHNQPKDGDPRSSGAWASRRTWEMAYRALAGAEVHGLAPSETEVLLSGCVGEAAATKFVRYVLEADLPNPAELLDSKITWKPDARLDRTAAVFASCAALVLPVAADKRDARAKKLWELLAEQVKVAADVVVPAVSALCGKGRLSGMPAAAPVLLKLHPVFEAARLLP